MGTRDERGCFLGWPANEANDSVDLGNLGERFLPPKLSLSLSLSLPVAKVITFSDVRWTTISYRRGIATYRPLSLARTSRILFLGCGFARYTLLGNWTWSGHAGSALAAHLLPLLYLWVAKFTKRCGPNASNVQQRAPLVQQQSRSTLHGSKPSDELARRPRTPAY